MGCGDWGKKYGRIKLKEIFKNEFVYYSTIANSKIKNIINTLPNIKDLLIGGLLNDSFSLDSSTYRYEIKEGKLGFNIDIWKHEEDTYKEIKESDVINKHKAYLIKNGTFINDVSELLDEEWALKECFNKIFEKIIFIMILMRVNFMITPKEYLKSYYI